MRHADRPYADSKCVLIERVGFFIRHPHRTYAHASRTRFAFKAHQGALAAIIKSGGNVIVCPMCMKHYGVEQSDLIDGAKTGNPELTGGLLFADDTKTLTWQHS